MSRRIIILNVENKLGIKLAKCFYKTKSKLCKSTTIKILYQLYSFKMRKKEFDDLMCLEKSILK